MGQNPPPPTAFTLARTLQHSLPLMTNATNRPRLARTELLIEAARRKDVLWMTSELETLEQLRGYLARALETGESWKAEGHLIIQAVDEAVANIIEHGYSGQPGYPIEIEIEVTPREVTVRLRDFALPFDPTHAADFRISGHIRGGATRGLGVFMIRRLVDDVRYVRPADGGNQLILIKRK